METKESTVKDKLELATELSHKYETGTESEDVECFCKLDDPKPGKKSYYAIEDNRLIETIDMTDEEKISLPFAVFHSRFGPFIVGARAAFGEP